MMLQSDLWEQGPGDSGSETPQEGVKREKASYADLTAGFVHNYWGTDDFI